MSSPNGSLRYHVSVSKKVAAEAKGLGKETAEAGLSEAFIAALEQINARLKRDPDVFGEPRYTLKHLGLQVRIAIISPCVVNFAVNLQARTVFVYGFRLLLPV